MGLRTGELKGLRKAGETELLTSWLIIYAPLCKKINLDGPSVTALTFPWIVCVAMNDNNTFACCCTESKVPNNKHGDSGGDNNVLLKRQNRWQWSWRQLNTWRGWGFISLLLPMGEFDDKRNFRYFWMSAVAFNYFPMKHKNLHSTPNQQSHSLSFFLFFNCWLRCSTLPLQLKVVLQNLVHIQKLLGNREKYR